MPAGALWAYAAPGPATSLPLQLRIENAALQQQNMIFGKVLAVRDAMVHTLSTLHARPQREEQQAAAQGLAYALEELPSELEMEEAAGSAGAAVVQQQQQPPQQQQQGQRRVLARTPSQTSAASTQPREGQQAQQQPVPSGSSSPSGDRSANTVQHGAPPRWALVEHHRAGTAAQLDGSALQAVDSIPPPSDELIKATVMAMSEPEHLVSAVCRAVGGWVWLIKGTRVAGRRPGHAPRELAGRYPLHPRPTALYFPAVQLDYYRQWQAELAASYLAAEAGGFDDASVAEVEAVQERMASVWWHVGHMKPAYLCYLTNAALPEDSAQFPLWRELAERLLPELDENSRAILVRATQHRRRPARSTSACRRVLDEGRVAG